MKKLIRISTSITLCLLFCLFAGCEKKPLDESGGGDSGGGTSKQKGIIEGVVTAKDTDKPVLLASVQLLPADRLTLTDTTGSFTFEDIEPGNYQIQVKRNGYTTYTSEDIKVEAGKTVRHDVILETIKSSLQILNAYGEVIEELHIGDDATQGVFILKNAGNEIIDWEIPKLAETWVSGFSKQSGKLAPEATDTIELSINRSNLSAGVNEAILYIGSSVGDKKLVIKVGVERSFCFTDEAGEEIIEVDMSDIDQYRFKIKNTGNDVLTWILDDIEADWLTFVGKTDGKLAVGENEARTLKVDRTRLDEGTYETTLIFHSNAGEKTLSVKHKIEMGVRLEDPYGSEITELDFGSVSSQQFRIKNTGNGVLNWEVSSVGSDWLTLGNKRSGSLQAGTTETITVTIDRSLLSAGDNHAMINISTNAGDKQLEVNAHIELSYQLVGRYDKEIDLVDMGREPSVVFWIKNTGNGALRWEISSSSDWLELRGDTKGSLEPDDVAMIPLSVDQIKAMEGTNETILHIGSPAGNKQLPVRFLKYIGTVGSDYVESIGSIELQMVPVQGGVFLRGGDRGTG